MPGSTLVLTGPAGTGKSTVLLQTSNGVAIDGRRVLFVSGEQSRDDILQLAARIGIFNDQVDVLGNEGDVYAIVEEAEQQRHALLVVDSLQTCSVGDAGGDEGSAEQCKATMNILTAFGKRSGVAILIVSHVNSSGVMAGPTTLEHLCDGVVYFEPYDPFDDDDLDKDVAKKLTRADLDGLRVLRSSTKMRNGPSGVRAVLEMTERGLRPASRRFSNLVVAA